MMYCVLTRPYVHSRMMKLVQWTKGFVTILYNSTKHHFLYVAKGAHPNYSYGKKNIDVIMMLQGEGRPYDKEIVFKNAYRIIL